MPKLSRSKKIQRLFGKIGRRQRFIISTFILAILYTVATFFSFQDSWIFVPIIMLVVYGLTYFSILTGITRHEWVTLFMHPMYFSVVFYLFYFFVPQRWLTRIPFVLIYLVSTYAILLSQNIFNVGVAKSLQLYRAAFSVNYLFLTISAFLSYSLIVSLRLHFLLNMLLVFLASYPLVLHMLWTIEPKDFVGRHLLKYATFISILLAEAAILLSFMPVNQSIFALMLTSIFYSLSGIFHMYIQGTLYREKIREYIVVLGFALLVLILTLRW